MKKTYTTPVILMSGTVVHETLSQDLGLAESSGFTKRSGAVGFNL
jgi:hypothetical protein